MLALIGLAAKGVVFEIGERDNLERPFVSGFHDNGRRHARLRSLAPAPRTDAPAIACFEPGKSILWPRRG